jgi:hypothetical protein
VVPLPEVVGAHRQEEAELYRHTDFVPASNPGQLAKRGIIRTENKLGRTLRLEDRRRGKSGDCMSKVIHT